LGAYDYVNVVGALGSLAVNNLVSGGTVNLQGVSTGDEVTTVSVTDAATGAADVLNVVTTSIVDGDVNVGEVVAANVETINITTANFAAIPATAVDIHTLDVTAVNATSIVIDGDAALTLDNSANVAAATIDASALTGNLTVTTAGGTATTVTGGAGADDLTASFTADALIGGAGNDTLTVGAGANLVTLTGGEGSDTFVFGISDTVNDYATITDLSSGDVIDLTDGESFLAAAITLGDTAVFQDYANAATAATGDAAWFQFAGNTYIAVDAGNDNGDFANGADSVIKITGAVDLSTASYNLTNGTLEIA